MLAINDGYSVSRPEPRAALRLATGHLYEMESFDQVLMLKKQTEFFVTVCLLYKCLEYVWKFCLSPGFRHYAGLYGKVAWMSCTAARI